MLPSKQQIGTKKSNKQTIRFFATFRLINRSLPDHKTDCQNGGDYKTGLVHISPFPKQGKNYLDPLLFSTFKLIFNTREKDYQCSA